MAPQLQLLGKLSGFMAIALMVAPSVAAAASTPSMIDGAGAPAFCGTALIRNNRTAPFAEYCRAVEQTLRHNGPFDAALVKAHRVYASIYFTALADGRVVAAVFLRGSGNRQIDLGLMNALEHVRLPRMRVQSETFAVPIELRAKNHSPAVAYYIPVASEN